MLESVKIEPEGEAEYLVVWLHGLGADGHDFEAIVPELALPSSAKIKYIFPHAPIRPVTINGGHKMRAWYDILAINIDREIDSSAIEASVAQIAQIVNNEIEAGMKASNILIAGFSQGGVIALTYALSAKLPFAGILALSTYFPTDQMPFLGNLNDLRKDIPIFVGHGKQDPVVPLILGDTIVAKLRLLEMDVRFETYNMPHSVCHDEIVHISEFMKKVFKIK